MPTPNNRSYNLAYGEEVALTTYPDNTIYTTDVKYNVFECERDYATIYRNTSLWYARHIGVDLAGNYHAPLYAVADAKVIEAVNWGDATGSWGSASSGTYVALEIAGCYGCQVVTVYKHLSSKTVNVGDFVKKGSLIGYQGTTGNSTGEHLHFELWIDGKLYDPIPYLEERKSFVIRIGEPTVNIAVKAKYQYIDGGFVNIRKEPSTKSSDIGDLPNGTIFDVELIQDNEGYTWGKIVNDGWVVLYAGTSAWCVPIACTDNTEQIAILEAQIAELDAENDALIAERVTLESEISTALSLAEEIVKTLG